MYILNKAHYCGLQASGPLVSRPPKHLLRLVMLTFSGAKANAFGYVPNWSVLVLRLPYLTYTHVVCHNELT
jgi:hypothetical protein